MAYGNYDLRSQLNCREGNYESVLSFRTDYPSLKRSNQSPLGQGGELSGRLLSNWRLLGALA